MTRLAHIIAIVAACALGALALPLDGDGTTDLVALDNLRKGPVDFIGKMSYLDRSDISRGRFKPCFQSSFQDWDQSLYATVQTRPGDRTDYCLQPVWFFHGVRHVDRMGKVHYTQTGPVPATVIGFGPHMRTAGNNNLLTRLAGGDQQRPLPTGWTFNDPYQ